jgi:predicted SAM-dependent methyltransferase
MEKSSLLNIVTDRVLVNLGSGQKKMQGFVNVDINPDNNPDVVASALDYLESLADESVDEVHMYHVLEHFAKPEALEVLENTQRVLKKDGLVVVECPDLMKCCINVLQAKVKGDNYRIERFGLLGIYGEQDSTEHMFHKWGYWPEYLGSIFVELGFSGCYEEIPQSKDFAQEERDFRLVGVK